MPQFQEKLHSLCDNITKFEQKDMTEYITPYKTT
jgi:hypothetical protein